ncbi:MAG: serine protease [Spirochaetaceae bacterium]
MLRQVSQRFQGSCLMLMQQNGREVTFLGTAFLAHPDGYVLTAARIIPEDAGLVIVPAAVGDEFLPVTREEVAPVPVEVLARDMTRDVALLQLTPDLQIGMPEKILGAGDTDPRGALLMTIGVPFGYYQIHTAIVSQAILAGRVRSHTGTNLIIFDRRVQVGDVGGPLISADDGAVIGIVGGVFDPIELEGREPPQGGVSLHSDLSYATSIEYGAGLLENALRETSSS